LNTTPRMDRPILALYLLCLSGCAEDAGEQTEAPADAGIVLDAEPDLEAPAPFPLCDIAVEAARPASACATSRDCAPNELCVNGSEGAAVCATLCFPDDCPTSSCGENAECAALQVDVGQPFVADVNGDGDEESIGACLLLPELSSPTWGPCNNAMGCTAPDVCIRLPGRESGVCTPPCGAYCLPTAGFQTTCVGTSGGGSVCVIPCDPALSAGQCPPDNACVTAGTGFALCSW
jgi:hypothetical protein